MIKMIIAASALAVSAIGANAATFNYDFKKEANSSGQIGEAIFSTFNTSTNGVFSGPNLEVTATKDGNAAYVYFDNGNAGMGVCGTPKDMNNVGNYNSGSGENQCSPSNDDGLTAVNEVLTFGSATELFIKSIYINSNHDGGYSQLLTTEWNINGTVYTMSDFVDDSLSQDGDIRIDVNFTLAAGSSFDIFGTKGPNSYISGIGFTDDGDPNNPPVIPLPAGGVLLLTGMGVLALTRRRKSA